MNVIDLLEDEKSCRTTIVVRQLFYFCTLHPNKTATFQHNDGFTENKLNCLIYDCVALSSLPITAKMNAADSRQHTTRTSHNPHSGKIIHNAPITLKR